MRVLVAGAAGVIGRPPIHRLTAAGHDAVALTSPVPKRAQDQLSDDR
jgi:nucleoside-diphosphate-sugar epimerase